MLFLTLRFRLVAANILRYDHHCGRSPNKPKLYFLAGLRWLWGRANLWSFTTTQWSMRKTFLKYPTQKGPGPETARFRLGALLHRTLSLGIARDSHWLQSRKVCLTDRKLSKAARAQSGSTKGLGSLGGTASLVCANNFLIKGNWNKKISNGQVPDLRGPEPRLLCPFFFSKKTWHLISGWSCQ